MCWHVYVRVGAPACQSSASEATELELQVVVNVPINMVTEPLRHPSSSKKNTFKIQVIVI